jgi:hypothetical protein
MPVGFFYRPARQETKRNDAGLIFSDTQILIEFA